MVRPVEPLDLTATPEELTVALVDIASVSRQEAQIADAVEEALRRQCPQLEILRNGNAVLARTKLGRSERVILAGHLDTVPVADNLPARIDDEVIHGCGTTDMKSGDAVFLHLLATIDEPRYDITLILYDKEELPPKDNGIGRIIADHPDWLIGTAAILGEPTNGVIEAGCQGTLWARIEMTGTRAHSARGWLGSNAIHVIASVLQRLDDYTGRVVEIDGCTFREGLEAVDISGGTALNVVPDRCTVIVNFRFAPDRTAEEAADHVREIFADLPAIVETINAEPGAKPGEGSALLDELTAAAGGEVVAKLGWTDVSRFAARGIAAVNLGPGDPNLAHTPGEFVRIERIRSVTDALKQLLTGTGHNTGHLRARLHGRRDVSTPNASPRSRRLSGG